MSGSSNSPRDRTPRLYVFDPLARMKAASRNEKDQSDMGVLIEAMRDLRNATGSTVVFVHHHGHQGDHMRGSSDLESAWETKVMWKRDAKAKLVTLQIEHRDTEPSPDVVYGINWDGLTRTMRFDAVGARTSNVHDDVVAYLDEHPGATGRDIEAAVTGRGSLIRKVLEQLIEAGTHYRAAAEKRDAQGRRHTVKGYFSHNHAPSLRVPDDGTQVDADSPVGAVRPSPLRSKDAQRRDAQ